MERSSRPSHPLSARRKRKRKSLKPPSRRRKQGFHPAGSRCGAVDVTKEERNTARRCSLQLLLAPSLVTTGTVRSRSSRRSRRGLNHGSFMCRRRRRLGFLRCARGQGHHGDDGGRRSEHDQFFHKLNSFFKEQFVGSRFGRCIKENNSS